MRGCEPCVSCMGLGLNKGIKIFESMFYAKKTTAKFWAIIIIPAKFLSLLVYVVIRIFNKIVS